MRFPGQPLRTDLRVQSPIINDLYTNLVNRANELLQETPDWFTRHWYIEQWMRQNLNIHSTRIIAFQYFHVDSANKTKIFCMREISQTIFQRVPYANAYANAYANPEANVILNYYADNRLAILDYAMMLVNIGRDLIENVHFENHQENPSNKRYLSNIAFSDEPSEELEQLCECPICYGDDIQKKNILTTNCGHDFCKDCICRCIDGTSLLSIPTCPMCREDVTSLVAREDAIHQDLVSKYN